MKKFLVVLLACAMIFAFASTALAADKQIVEFSDIADQSVPVKNAIMKLAVLGVLEGNEGVGGAIRPADNLTRAEFAKIVCYLTDNVKIANSLATVGSKFSDVSTGNWYTGWVNAAAQSGYFMGDPGGTFRPNANITMQEVVTVALRCAGYNDKLPGTWPGNYVLKAQNVGLLDDVTFVGSAAATRADMAVICEAVLGINMVVHISNDIAYALGLSTGDVDPDGFSEIYYVSNETQRNKVYETILRKAFKGEYFDLVIDPAYVSDGTLRFDETEGWKYEDFASGELSLNVSGANLWDDDKKFEELRGYSISAAGVQSWDTYTASEELASTYYITRGLDLTDLSGMQAQLTVIDKKEICFVDVVSSKQDAAEIYKSGTNIMVDGKGLRPSNTVNTNNRIDNIFDMSAGFTFTGHPDASARRIWALSETSSDDTFGGRLYLDKDGRVYAVKNYDVYNGMNNVTLANDSEQRIGFSIFDKVDSGIAQFKGNAAISTVKLDKDYVLYKDGEQVKFEDLDQNDLVYYLGKGVNAKFFIAYSPAEGELTNQTNTKLTVAGTGYRVDWNYNANTVDGVADNYFQFSDDGGESFRALNIRLPQDQIDSFGDALYAKAYNFNRLAYVASNLNFSKIIGVVTKITPANVWDNGAFLPRYEEVTIYNTEGKEVTYKFTTNFRDGYNALMNIVDPGKSYVTDDAGLAAHWTDAVANLAAGKRNTLNANGLAKGDIVQLTLDNKDAIKRVANYTQYDPAATASLAQVQTSKSRITWGGNGFTLHKDAIVFSVSPKSTGAYDDVSIVSLANILASDFYAKQLDNFDVKTSGDVMVMYVVGDNTSVRFGVHTGNAKNDALGVYYTINGTRYTAATSSSLPGTPAVAAYTLSSGEVTFANTINRITASTTAADAEAAVLIVNNGYAAPVQLWTERADYGVVTGWNYDGKFLTVDGQSYYITDSSYLYDLDDDDVIDNPAELRSDSRRVVVFFDRNGDITFLAALNASGQDGNMGVATIAGKDAPGWFGGNGTTVDARRIGTVNLTATEAANLTVANQIVAAEIVASFGTVTFYGNDATYTTVPAAGVAIPSTVYFTVTATNGDVTYYQVGITVSAASNNANLASLSYRVGNGAITPVPGFAAGTNTYNVVLPGNTSATANIVLIATLADANASIAANAGVTLALGAGTATVVVTPESGAAGNVTYTVNFTTAARSNVATLTAGTLAGVAITDTAGGGWAGDAAIATATALEVTITNAQAVNATLALTKGNANATVAIAPIVAAGGADPAAGDYTITTLNNLSLVSGDQIFIKVTAEDGTILYYTITVIVTN